VACRNLRLGLVVPPLDEGSILDMPVTVPRVSIAQAGDDIRIRDEIMVRFPEVDQVIGKVGRADTPTDPSGIDMVETIVTMRPKEWWPKRKIRFEDATANFSRTSPAKVDTHLAVRGPLLLTSGSEDHTAHHRRQHARSHGDGGAFAECAPVDLTESKLVYQMLEARIHPVVLHAPYRQHRRLPRLLPQRRVVRHYAF
jgi:hypothetical protein